ncbi:efflux RND transporter permease subunit [Proteiniclasticum ruminis]|uniref:Multidrug efflux pump subunit AcrB n=1 Tax=Proteiniclasticum ruminis TaxID=398199 RepID=A0A1I5B885_9CLOT|nr:efflux RND transporter permease subunit [Proteiniclasticum ruminis]SFN70923.1 Multidrug efflux pump subunit AcrB [Proteiniclasticum ruminis]
MISKYSVKKPYTVVVAVILTILLGVISFLGMKTDLLPSLDLPFVVVITPYPGASPEKVEQLVTRPLEAALGTSSGLSSMNSTSSENSSLIFLEFVQGTNMDSVMIELSGSLDQVKARLEEGIGTPILMRISPDMLPIVVASVDVEGMSLDELSAFTEEEIMPSFERLDGVAAVTGSGLVASQLEVSLLPEKIAVLNERVKNHLLAELAKNETELKNAMTSLESGQKTLAAESQNQKEQVAKASVELSSAMANLNALLAEEAKLTAEKAALEATRDQLRSVLDMNAIFTALFPEGTENLTLEDLQLILSSMESGAPEAMEGMTEEMISGLSDQVQEAVKTLVAVELELSSLNVRQMTLSAMKPELQKGLNQSKAAAEQLEAGKITMAVELAKAEVQMATGKTELEKGLAAFEDAKKQALESADLTGILTEEMVKNILMAQNFSMPAGYIEEGDGQILVKVGDAFEKPVDIRDLVVFSMEPIGDIKLNEVAEVEKRDNSDEIYTKINGNNGVLLTFQKQSTSSTAEVSDLIHSEIEKLEGLHENLSITPMMDQGEYIDMTTSSVMENLLFGGILAILVLILFLRDLKPTFVIALSIPISLTFAVVLMYFSNVTLNVISLSGLALGVGMLVDNSIVVIENIYRLRKEGMPAKEAAITGANEVAGAIFASTLTTVSVFLPIVFTEGISRQLFTDMGLTIGYSLIASLIVALTLVPSMGATMLKTTSEKEHKWFDKTVQRYEKLLGIALKYKMIVVLFAVGLLGLSIYLTTTMGTAFIPEVDSPQMSASYEASEGLETDEVNALNDDIVERILSIDAVETVGVMRGGSGFMGFGGGGGTNNGDASTFYILLKDERSLSNKEVEQLIYENTEDLGGEMSVSASNMDISAFGGSGIQVKVEGFDPDEMAVLAKDVAKVLSETEGTEDVTTGLEDAGEEIRITVDKVKAIREGLTVAQVFAEVSKALSQEMTATQLTEMGASYPVVLLKPIQEGLNRNTVGDLSMVVQQRDGSEKTVILKDIATVEVTESVQSISRENQSRYMTVSASIKDGYNIGLVGREVEEKFASFEVPEGYKITFEGENETINDTLGDLVIMITLAVVFIYLIMVAQFQNLLSPFIVLFTLPLAFTGGLLLLYIAGMELSIIAMLGFLVLAGVVVNNGIVFVDYVNQLRERGIEKREAILRTGATRIRPIIMTALTTILALTTLALGYGSGAEMMQPMAVVTVGGLTYATLLTLFVVPVLYDLFVRVKKRNSLKSENSEEVSS